jgi:hypothetical protein
MLVLRFVWLNRPTPKEFADSLGLKLYALTHFSLISGTSTKSAFDPSHLRDVLHLSETDWRQGLLPKSVSQDMRSESFRSCDLCLEVGYHSAIFQLQPLAECPIHRLPLKAGCPKCGQRVLDTLAEGGTMPYSCRGCGAQLIKNRMLIDPPSLNGTGRLRQIFDWLANIEDLAHVSSTKLSEFGSKKSREYLETCVLMGSAIGKEVPELLSIDREQLGTMRVLNVLCGIHVSDSERKVRNTHLDRLENLNEQMDISLYKWYRRKLVKSLGRSRRYISLFVEVSAHPWNKRLQSELENASDEIKVEIFAIMLFIFTVEGWGGVNGIKARQLRLEQSFDNLFASKGSDFINPRCSTAFRCSDSERDWIRTHMLLDGLAAIMEEARHRSREMVESRHYYMVDLSLRPGDAYPFSMACLDNDGILQYWLMARRADHSLYSLDQAEFMMPGAMKLFFKKDEVRRVNSSAMDDAHSPCGDPLSS